VIYYVVSFGSARNPDGPDFLGDDFVGTKALYFLLWLLDKELF
jgi:hypothetical protein